MILMLVFITALDPDLSPDEAEEKERLIAQVLELQNTLDGVYLFNYSLYHVQLVQSY